jgi:hypothetical protein
MDSDMAVSEVVMRKVPLITNSGQKTPEFEIADLCPIAEQFANISSSKCPTINTASKT